MIALLLIQIAAVHFFGIEPKFRRLEEIQQPAQTSRLPGIHLGQSLVLERASFRDLCQKETFC